MLDPDCRPRVDLRTVTLDTSRSETGDDDSCDDIVAFGDCFFLLLVWFALVFCSTLAGSSIFNFSSVLAFSSALALAVKKILIYR